jgi:hypothetical protein
MTPLTREAIESGPWLGEQRTWVLTLVDERDALRKELEQVRKENNALLEDARDCIEDLIFKPPERSKSVGGLDGRCRLVLDEIAKRLGGSV